MPLHVSSTCAHHQEVKIALHSLWYHHTYRWPSRAQDDRCDDTRGCVMQFWPPGDEHVCSKHVEAWNKTYCRTKRLCIKLVNYWDKLLYDILYRHRDVMSQVVPVFRRSSVTLFFLFFSSQKESFSLLGLK